MSKGIIYIDYDEALNIYGKMIDASDGGFEGVRDEGGIRATLDFVQNDLYYPTFADKLTYLMYRFCSVSATVLSVQLPLWNARMW